MSIGLYGRHDNIWKTFKRIFFLLADLALGVKYFRHCFRPLDYILVLISKLEPGPFDVIKLCTNTRGPGSSSGVECPLYNGHCKKAGDMGINLHEPEAWPEKKIKNNNEASSARSALL